MPDGTSLVPCHSRYGVRASLFERQHHCVDAVRVKRRHVLAKPSACMSEQALSSKLETDHDVGRLVLRDLAQGQVMARDLHSKLGTKATGKRLSILAGSCVQRRCAVAGIGKSVRFTGNNSRATPAYDHLIARIHEYGNRAGQWGQVSTTKNATVLTDSMMRAKVGLYDDAALAFYRRVRSVD